MAVLVQICLLSFLTAGVSMLEERIDRYHPASGAFLGTERTFYDADGRRLRWTVTDASGSPTLLFFVLHDERGRESEAIYFESSPDPTRERFTWADDGTMRTTTYFHEPGEPSERTESDLDREGREIRKRYYKQDGTQYGEEDVLWNPGGTQQGWDFRFTQRDGGASFRYAYSEVDGDGEWVRRTRSRDGAVEWLEVRTLRHDTSEEWFLSPAVFAPGVVSTERAETSPSFAADGRTMVFARYDDWTRKEAFLGVLTADAWRVEALPLGDVYNLAISPDAAIILFSTRDDDDRRRLFRIRRGGEGWTAPEDLSRAGVVGTYPCLTGKGRLVLFDADGAEGSGVYGWDPEGDGYRGPQPLVLQAEGAAFDAYLDDAGTLLLTRCLDDVCDPGPDNGVWQRRPDGSLRKVPHLPYVWGVQPVDSLGVLVFTDGDEILAVPLEAAGLE